MGYYENLTEEKYNVFFMNEKYNIRKVYAYNTAIKANIFEVSRKCCLGGIIFATVNNEETTIIKEYTFTIYGEIEYDTEICIEDKADILVKLKDKTGVANLRYFTILPIQILDNTYPMTIRDNEIDELTVQRFIERANTVEDKDIRLYIPEIFDEYYLSKGKSLPTFAGRKLHREISVAEKDDLDGMFFDLEIECEEIKKILEFKPKQYNLHEPEGGVLAVPVLEYNNCEDLSYEMQLRNKINSFIHKKSFEAFYQEIQKSVVGQDELGLVLTNIWSYLNCIGRNIPANNNMIIAAPSGCGKTETYRAIKKFFMDNEIEIPIAQVDMTSITEEGFKGGDTDDCLRSLFDNFRTNGIGIVFLDEFDKKLVPSYGERTGNVNLAVQSQLLTVIEGAERKDKNGNTINTANTLFIGLGAFNMCREFKKNKTTSIGFNAEAEKMNHYDIVTRQDMINIGGSYELLGRFVQIINYHKLNKEAIKLVIKKYADKIANVINIPVIVEKKAIDELCDEANSEYGCRLINSILSETVMRGYQDIMLVGADSDDVVIVLEEARKQRYKMIS